MSSPWQRVLKAYHPVYQRGLLMDGLYPWPSDPSSDDSPKPASRPGRRVLLIALTGWRASMLFRRGEP
jgi:hypothetical protein